MTNDRTILRDEDEDDLGCDLQNNITRLLDMTLDEIAVNKDNFESDKMAAYLYQRSDDKFEVDSVEIELEKIQSSVFAYQLEAIDNVPDLEY